MLRCTSPVSTFLLFLFLLSSSGRAEVINRAEAARARAHLTHNSNFRNYSLMLRLFLLILVTFEGHVFCAGLDRESLCLHFPSLCPEQVS